MAHSYLLIFYIFRGGILTYSKLLFKSYSHMIMINDDDSQMSCVRYYKHIFCPFTFKPLYCRTYRSIFRTLIIVNQLKFHRLIVHRENKFCDDFIAGFLYCNKQVTVEFRLIIIIVLNEWNWSMCSISCIWAVFHFQLVVSLSTYDENPPQKRE